MSVSAATTHDPVVQDSLENDVRVASHALNRGNLLKGLIKDAHGDKPDIECEVKNYGGNLNLHCNSGFFLAVAKPAFSNLCAGFQAGVGLFAITMPSNPTVTRDTTGLYQTTLFQFNITSTSDPS